MTYLLEELLTIRKYRDKIALGHTLTAKKELDDAKTKQAESISELMSFTKWRQKKEKKLFEQLMHQTIKICDLELFYQYIEFLIDKQISLVDNIKKREQEVLNAEEKLKKAQEHYVKLNQAKQKLEEHKNICSQEKYLQNERQEDNEQDEFNTNVKVHIWP
jgi:hypothetical protein